MESHVARFYTGQAEPAFVSGKIAEYQTRLTAVVSEIKECQTASTEGGADSLCKKKILCFLGLPGTGKTTQITEIKDVIGARVLHAGKLAKENGVDHETARSQGKLIEGVNDLVLDSAAALDASTVILDGFPRSQSQVAALTERAKQSGWDMHFFYFSFAEGNGVRQSFDRQYARDTVEKPGKDHTERILGKIKRSIEEDLMAVKSLVEAGFKIELINAEAGRSEITRRIYDVLGNNFDSLKWEDEILQTVAKASDELGIEAWPGAGLLYRPFWNGRFGPVQESTDKDIHVASAVEAKKLLEKLEEMAPDVRWSVDNRLQDTKELYGIESANLEVAMKTFPLTFRQGGVRYKNGKREVIITKQAEHDLQHGILRIDESLLVAMSPEWQEKILDRSLGRAVKMLGEYPALRLEGRLKESYIKKYGEREPERIVVEWDKIQTEVWEQEYGGCQTWLPERFTAHEKMYGELVRQFYLNADKTLTAPEVPKKFALPEPLETYRKHKLALEMGQVDVASVGEIPKLVEPPEGYDSWFHFVGKNCSDGVFKEWFLNQVRSRNPIGGKDEAVRVAIELTKADTQFVGQQKATHLGLPLYKHTQEAVLQSSTDWLETNDWPDEEKKMYRLCLRMAMLYHDHGKVHNMNTPGSHEGIGAKIWERNAPSWLSKEEVALTKWMIQTHDVFGRLARGLTEKNGKKTDDKDFDVTTKPAYSGALDPEAVREYLQASGLPLDKAVALHQAVWQADVKSVSALRWLLPVADMLREMVSPKV